MAFPTETVFGLGVDATNPNAVRRLFEAKGRPSDNPLIVHLSEVSKWRHAAAKLTPAAEALLAAYAPGPLTVVLPKQPSISSLVSAGLETVGIRVPDHPDALAILQAADIPVAAPSANRSGRPSCTTWQAVLEDLDGQIDAVYCGDAGGVGIESTVVDCCGDTPVILRPGAITLEQLRQVIPTTRGLVDTPVNLDAASRANGTSPVRSPGLAHPHYQPRAQVRLVKAPLVLSDTLDTTAYCGMHRFAGMERLPFVAIYDSVEDFAAGFYEFLREVDRRGLDRVLVEEAPEVGIGEALLDRQRRAAGL